MLRDSAIEPLCQLGCMGERTLWQTLLRSRLLEGCCAQSLTGADLAREEVSSAKADLDGR